MSCNQIHASGRLAKNNIKICGERECGPKWHKWMNDIWVAGFEILLSYNGVRVDYIYAAQSLVCCLIFRSILNSVLLR